MSEEVKGTEQVNQTEPVAQETTQTSTPEVKTDVQGSEASTETQTEDKKLMSGLADISDASKGEEESKDSDEKQETKVEKADLDKLKVPENLALNLDDFKEFAKDKGFSQDVAQELLDRENNIISNVTSEMDNNLEKIKKEDALELSRDKELGGHNLKETVAAVHNVFQTFGNPDLEKLVTDSGIDVNKHFVKFCVDIHKQMEGAKFFKGAEESTKTTEHYTGDELNKLEEGNASIS